MKELLFKSVCSIISLLLYIPGFLALYNWLYERSCLRVVNVFHQYVKLPRRKHLWKIKLLNGKKVKTWIYLDNYKTLQLALDYKWYAPGLAILENRIFNHFGEKMTYVDIGANLGMRSLNALSRHLKVIMFEPNSEVSDLNQERCELNGFTNYTIVRKGVSDHSGVSVFHLDASSYKSSLNFTESTEFTNHLEIDITTIDDNLKNEDLTHSLFKIDVEGHESQVISGGKTLIEKYRPTMIIEINEKGDNFNGIFQHFNKLGYKCLGIQSAATESILFEISGKGDAKINDTTDFLFIHDDSLFHALKSNL